MLIGDMKWMILYQVNKIYKQKWDESYDRFENHIFILRKKLFKRNMKKTQFKVGTIGKRSIT